MKALSRMLVSLFLLAACLSIPALAAEFHTVNSPVQGQYIVVLRDDQARLAGERSSAPTVDSVAHDMARLYGLELDRAFSHVLRGFVVRADERALLDLMLDERVAFVEEDGIVRIGQATQQNATWGLDRVDQRNLPLDGTYTFDTTAANVYTYIVDTGVRTSHSDFGGRVVSGFTAINDGRGTNDCNGHGTHVAGTVAGANWGVAKAARIVPVRVLNCQGSGTNSGVIAGMDWIAANHIKPAVANMSLGGGASVATDNAVANMRNAGVTVVVAAGNENQNACNVSPARSSNAITVGATTSTDARSNFSNWGSCVDIFAPGSSIRSAWHTSNTAANTISGTSMAAPHVAGIAALYLANNPQATPAQVENAVLGNASTGRLSGLNGSPNLLAYSRFGGGQPAPVELDNGVPVANLSGGQGSEQHFFIEVPADAQDLVITISGGSGDADLYVRRGAPPTVSTWDCRPYLNGNNETCSFANPQPGTWYVMIRGFQAYSGATLQASYQEPPTAPCTNCTQYSGTLSGTGQTQQQPDGTWYQSGAGVHRGWLEGPANANFDLELYRWNGSRWVRVARSNSANSSEFIQYNGTAGFYTWLVRSVSGGGAYDFWLQRP